LNSESANLVSSSCPALMRESASAAWKMAITASASFCDFTCGCFWTSCWAAARGAPHHSTAAARLSLVNAKYAFLI